MEPVFLLSLPRSGSTLLQRMIGGHPEVATTSEPWILLPLLYTMRRPGVYAEYNHRSAVKAIQDFCDQLGGGRDRYILEMREFVLGLYEAASDGERYFLDKTPRYHLVVDEIMELFPDAKFIFLWRHPLATAASVLDSFGGGKWNLDKFTVDLVDGVDNLVAAFRHGDERCLSLRYEDLVRDPEVELDRVLSFLGLDADAVDGLSDRPLEGRMRDRTGVEQYQQISTEPLDKWRTTFGTAYRRRWSRRYLDRLGRHRIEAMGYEFDQLRREVDTLGRGPRSLVSDVARHTYWSAHRRMTCRLIYPSQAEVRRRRSEAPLGELAEPRR